MDNYLIYIIPLFAYLLGSIPSAVWIGKLMHGVDVREHGSGNAGATNTFRVLGKKAGIFVLLLDLLKGTAAVLLARQIEIENIVNFQILVGICAVLGHVFPIFANFKGGKGVATLLGLMLGIHPMGSLICASVFLILLITTKYVSVGSMIGGICFPFLMFFVFKEDDNLLPYFGILIAIMLLVTHKKNINRLLAGNENKTYLFGKK